MLEHGARDAAAAGPGREGAEGLGKLKRLADSLPKTVRSGPSQEVVMEPDLDVASGHDDWPGDPAPFITLPAVITKDPRTGSPQYRHVPDAAHRRANDRDALADPQERRVRLRARHWASGSRSPSRSGAIRLDLRGDRAAPEGIDEWMFAGFLRGESVELVKAKTVDLEVPAAPTSSRGLRRSGRARSARDRSAITPATTRRRSRSRASTSPAITIAGMRSTRRSSWACRRRKTPGSARRPSGSSCRCSG